MKTPDDILELFNTPQQTLSREELDSIHIADPAVRATVQEFLKPHGMEDIANALVGLAQSGVSGKLAISTLDEHAEVIARQMNFVCSLVAAPFLKTGGDEEWERRALAGMAKMLSELSLVLGRPFMPKPSRN